MTIQINNETSWKHNNKRFIIVAEVNESEWEKVLFGVAGWYVGPWVLLEVCVTVASSSCECYKAGSSMGVASSSVFFREGPPCGMSVAEDAREVCLGC